jgi:alpha-glucosidase (family GH31 glycosyl hydrolase)
MLLEFLDDKRFAGEDRQLMFGPSLLMAPVLEAGTTQRAIKLPAGTWHDFWTQHTYTGGGEIVYAAPLERLPLLVRGGSILPLGPVLQHIPENHQFTELELHCYPPYPATFTLYEDDGRTRAYQRGEFSTTEVRVTGDGRRVAVVVEKTQGTFPVDSASRRMTVILHRASTPRSVQLNGQPFAAWEHSAPTHTLRLNVECPLTQTTLIEVDL